MTTTLNRSAARKRDIQRRRIRGPQGSYVCGQYRSPRGRRRGLQDGAITRPNQIDPRAVRSPRAPKTTNAASWKGVGRRGETANSAANARSAPPRNRAPSRLAKGGGSPFRHQLLDGGVGRKSRDVAQDAHAPGVEKAARGLPRQAPLPAPQVGQTHVSGSSRMPAPGSARLRRQATGRSTPGPARTGHGEFHNHHAQREGGEQPSSSAARDRLGSSGERTAQARR